MKEFTFYCPTCGQPILASKDWAGRRMRCPSCNTRIVLTVPTESRRSGESASSYRRKHASPASARSVSCVSRDGSLFDRQARQRGLRGVRARGGTIGQGPRQVPVAGGDARLPRLDGGCATLITRPAARLRHRWLKVETDLSSRQVRKHIQWCCLHR